MCVVHLEQHVELGLEVPDRDGAGVLENLDGYDGPVPPGLVNDAKLTLA